MVSRDYDTFPFDNREQLGEAVARLRDDPRYEMTDYGEGWLVFRLKPEYDIDR